jgi:hypothetical protein
LIVLGFNGNHHPTGVISKPDPLGRESLLLEHTMSFGQRVLLSVGILLIDLIVFFLPLTALFLVYIILANPVWFREFLEKLNHA